MSLSQPKKVNYSANQRLDLADKLAESTTADDNQNQVVKALITDSPDGRVMSGWRTTTVNGANSGFVIAAEQSAAVDRSGNVLILDGSVSLTVALTQNTINYVHAYYAETPSDPDTRRFFSNGSETLATTYTRLTRTPNLYKVTQAYGGGTPIFSGFQQTAFLGGQTVQLLPLYAVAVDNSNTITAVVDFRPMFAPAINGAGNNQYDATSGHADLPFNFAPATNAATLGIISTRRALVALADRIREIKGNVGSWTDASLNQWVRSSDGNSLSTPYGPSYINVGGNLQFTQGDSFASILWRGHDNSVSHLGNFIYGTISTGFSSPGGSPASNIFSMYMTDTARGPSGSTYQFLYWNTPGGLQIGASNNLTQILGTIVRVPAASMGIGGNPGAGIKLGVYGSMVIGADYAGNTGGISVPSNGLWVEGGVVASGFSLASSYTYQAVIAGSNVAGSTFVGFGFGSTVYPSNGLATEIPVQNAAVLAFKLPAGAIIQSYTLYIVTNSSSGKFSFTTFKSPVLSASSNIDTQVDYIFNASGQFVALSNPPDMPQILVDGTALYGILMFTQQPSGMATDVIIKGASVLFKINGQYAQLPMQIIG